MLKIVRKSLLYKTGVEYGDYTINHVLGCSHGCLYPCYAFMMARRFGRIKDYCDWLKPRLVENSLDLLKIEIPKYKKNIKSVHLCFTTDPFMVGYPEIQQMSIEIIRLLDSEGIKCTALTKGVLPIELSQFGNIHEWGISLISLNEDFRKKIEPFSAAYSDRIESMKHLHDLGFNTWVSMEPYPTPNIIDQEVSNLLQSVGFVQRIVFGRLHYNGLVGKFRLYQDFYDSSVTQVIRYCESNNVTYYIKAKTTITPR
jgi:DNA repair photolyase